MASLPIFSIFKTPSRVGSRAHWPPTSPRSKAGDRLTSQSRIPTPSTSCCVRVPSATASTRTANRRFRELIAEAIELDPNYAMARALLAEALYSQAVLGWTEFPDRELSRGADEARKAIALAPDEPDGYRALGRILLARGEYDQAKNALKRAIEINPSDANALAPWGSVQSFTGQIAGSDRLAPAGAETRSNARTELRLRSGGRLLPRAP